MAPTITSITSASGGGGGCVTSAAGSSVLSCPVAGGGLVTITGTDLGPAVYLTVSIGGNRSLAVGGVAYASSAAANATHLVDVSVPANAAGGFSVPVTVTYNGKSATANLLSYAGPLLTPDTLRLFTGTQSSRRYLFLWLVLF